MPNNDEFDTSIGSIADDAGSGAEDGGAQVQGDDGGGAGSPESAGTIADDGAGDVGSGQEGAQQSAQQAQAAPAEYRLTFDEKEFPMPAENLKAFTDVCRAKGLTNDMAQGVLDWFKSMYKADQSFGQQERARTLESWQKEIFEDREFGGANYKGTIAYGRKALHEFDPTGELRELLVRTGADRHPAVIRMAGRVGKAMGEHQFVGENGATHEARKIPLHERIYGASGTEQKHATY